ncbi:MAG TPA: flagellar type III secretion system pore protein FliP [Acidobacteriota bacterium]|nr:flagellar type III secretion system pore protein FliP [Acidobacteriota bacterium]
MRRRLPIAPRKAWRRVLLLMLVVAVLTAPVLAQQQPNAPSPNLNVSFGEGQDYSVPLQLLAVLTLLSFLPAMLISMTAFTRIIVVAHFIRQALGTQGAPSNQILIGLSLFLTLFVMGPTLEKVYDQAIVPYQSGSLESNEALEAAVTPIRTFMLKHVKEKELALFVKVGNLPQPGTPDDLPLRVIIPAFMLSELKAAFTIGFVIFLPFLIIDMVISSVLLSIGMMQLPPIVISTPFKILLFVLVDGWTLVVTSLIEGFA